MFSGFSTAANTFASAPMGRFSSTTLCAAATAAALAALPSCPTATMSTVPAPRARGSTRTRRRPSTVPHHAA